MVVNKAINETTTDKWQMQGPCSTGKFLVFEGDLTRPKVLRTEIAKLEFGLLGQSYKCKDPAGPEKKT